MKATAFSQRNEPMMFEAEIFTDIRDVFIRAGEIEGEDYDLCQTVDEEFNNCLYTYVKTIDGITSFKFLFKNTGILHQMQHEGMNPDEIQQRITNDCFHIIHMGENTDITPLTKDLNITEIEAMRLMLPDCYDTNRGPKLTWVD